MSSLIGPVSRILLRVIAYTMVTWGYFDPDIGQMIADDPDIAMIVQMGLGAVIAVGTEIWYIVARKMGWPT